MARADKNFEIAQQPNVRRYLDALAAAEGADYNVAFGGATFSDFSDHPRISKEFTQTDGKKNRSSAAGRYQFMPDTWDDVAGVLGLKDFSPRSQDIAAVELLRRSGSLDAVLQGDYTTAMAKDNKTWASLPGSPYAQRTRSPEFMQRLLSKEDPPSPVGEGWREAPQVDQAPAVTTAPHESVPVQVAAAQSTAPQPQRLTGTDPWAEFLQASVKPPVAKKVTPQDLDYANRVMNAPVLAAKPAISPQQVGTAANFNLFDG